MTGNGTTLTKHGFTDHEHLDNVGLIHMNGRVYDPMIGRFMSVDPVYQAPTNSQSVNPYTGKRGRYSLEFRPRGRPKKESEKG